MDAKRTLVVNYKQGETVVGNTSRVETDYQNPACLITFSNKSSAATYFSTFKNETTPNLGGVIWLPKEGPNVLVDICFNLFNPDEPLPFHIWKYDSTNRKIISMSYFFVRLFAGIRIGLRALHSCRWYHGRLLEGITTSNNLDVKLVNMSDQDMTFEDGMYKDLEDLRTLVEKVVASNPHATQYAEPDCLRLFRSFKSMFSGIILDSSIAAGKCEFYAFLTDINPIFASPVDRLILIKKLINLRELCKTEVDAAFTLEKDPAAMGRWWLKFKPGSYLHDRVSVCYYLYMAPDLSKEKNQLSVVSFLRSCFRHTYEGTLAKEDEDVEEVDLEASLLEAFPDCLPKLFYEFVRSLAWKKMPLNQRFDSYYQFMKESLPKFNGY